MNWIEKHIRTSYFLAFLFLFLGLPISKGLMSVGFGWLIGTWLLEGNLGDKFRSFSRNKPAIIATLIFPIEILGLVITSDLSAGWHIIKIHLPLYALPLIISTMPPLTTKEKSWYYGVFLLATSINIGICLLIGTGMTGTDIRDVRDASIFISHMRLSMMVVMCLLLVWHHNWPISTTYKTLVRVLLTLGFLLFLFWMKSLTAIIILLSISGIVALNTVKRMKFGQVGSWVGLTLFVGLVGYIATICWIESQHFTPSKTTVHLTQTPAGNPYWHDPSMELYENGNLVWNNINELELRHSWAERSLIPYHGDGKTNQNVRETLIRFLSSKGLTKDSATVSQLSDGEIVAIESGIANVRYMDGKDFSDRIYEVIWELNRYEQGANPTGNSLTQRIEFWKGATRAIQTAPVIGVGTGDGQSALNQAYEAEGVLLDTHWKKAHNQFLTFAIQYGIVGLLLILAAYALPFQLTKTSHSPILFLFLLLVTISMLTEDTLDTQAGTTFFALFYTLFIFAKHEGQSA